MTVQELIEAALNTSAEEALDRVIEVSNPFDLRKKLREIAPNLYKLLSVRGDLHDFSLTISDQKSPKADDLIKQFEIPANFKSDVEEFITQL